MPLVELEDRELARLRGIERDYADAANWRKVGSELMNDPKTKQAYWKVFKTKYPDVPTEHDTAMAYAQPLQDELEALKKQIAEDREAREKAEKERVEQTREQAAKNTIAEGRRRLKADGWDDEAIGKIEEIMQERGIGDYDVVAAYVRAQMPKPAMLNQGYEGRDLDWFRPGDDAPDAKLLMENPRKYKNDMIRKFMQDRANGNMQAWAA